MSIGIFTNKNYRPTETEISESIGKLLPIWKELLIYIRSNYKTQEDFKYHYGKNYGWALRFQVGGRLFTSFYPDQNGFTVQIILAPDAISRAQKMKLTKKVQDLIVKANPYPEGKWLFIPIETKKDIKDIQRLLELRSGKFL